VYRLREEQKTGNAAEPFSPPDQKIFWSQSSEGPDKRWFYAGLLPVSEERESNKGIAK